MLTSVQMKTASSLETRENSSYNGNVYSEQSVDIGVLSGPLDLARCKFLCTMNCGGVLPPIDDNLVPRASSSKFWTTRCLEAGCVQFGPPAVHYRVI